MLLWLLACAPKIVAPSPEPPQEVAPITAETLRAHVEVLASDDYAGRETLTPGREKAAAYLVEQLAPLGYQPLPGQEGPLVPFDLWRAGWSAQSQLTVGETVYKAGEHVRPFPFSAAGSLEPTEVVFAGYGIVAEEHGWDDFAGLDVEGKLVLVLRHEPGENDENSVFDGAQSSQHALFSTKAARIAERGGVGMLLVTDPLHHDASEDLRLPDRLTITEPQSAADGEVSMAPAAESPSLPAAQVSRTLAEALIGTELAPLQSRIDAGETPASLGVTGAAASMELVLGPAEAVQGHNVLAYLPGTESPDELVVIGAHYDHEGAFTGAGDTVFNGADDNASGTAAVLELARVLAAEGPFQRSVLLCFFDAEEKGLLGSRALLQQGQVQAEQVVGMINLDMLGRNPDRPVDVMGDGYATGVQDIVHAAADGTDLEYLFLGTRYTGNSDHAPFFERGVPIVNFFTGLHEDYHQLGDHPDKLGYARMATIAEVSHKVALELAQARWTPDFLHRVGWLGVTLREVGGGAVITELVEPSRGQEAGLAVGDVLAGVSLVQDVEPGTAVSLSVQRGEDVLSVDVERAKVGYLGVFPGPLADEAREQASLPPGAGLVLQQVVEEGPAAQAGLQAGDIVWMIDGVKLDVMALRTQLSRVGAGETVPFEVVREGERITVQVTLGERPQRR